MSMHPALSGRSTRVVIGMIERIVARHAGQITAAIENKKLSFRFTLSGSSSHAAGS
jgi:predicted Zn-dependent protease